MKQHTIGIFYFFILGIIFVSCATSNHKKENKNSAYRLIKTENLTEYKLLSFASNLDTILVVAKNNITEKCIEDNLFLTMLQNNSRINSLNDNGEEITFFYYTKGGENNNLRILTGGSEPGKTKRKIISYNCLPYFVENCDEIK